ncbi:hypothetical protein QLS91_03780 [Flavobacterium sp. LB2P84]|uniref:hypothetical protein n=1 Tax=Flavobacterium yafengii TaxID=3041253 RepID=UPI0024A8E643|nr:hypothetical protein [Flavobacterium yafengii]MDI6032184.1 hypothetical protein [Flavobacterium yafengii]
MKSRKENTLQKRTAQQGVNSYAYCVQNAPYLTIASNRESIVNSIKGRSPDL